MNFPLPGIGVVFDIDGLGGGYYGYRAWQLFMKSVDPKKLAASILVEGDTAATLDGRAREFCIGIYGMLDLNYVRDIFESVDNPGLAPVHRRFIAKLALDEQPLPIRGRIDARGRLVTDRWDRTNHLLCREAGWGYAPEEVSDLDPALCSELDQLRRR